MKFHLLSVMFRLKVGRGSFSSLGAVAGAAVAGAAVCTAVVCSVMSWMMESQVGVLSGVTYGQSGTEQARGSGGAMMVLDHREEITF